MTPELDPFARAEREAIQSVDTATDVNPRVDRRHAELYVEKLTGAAHRRMTFQTFDDDPERKGRRFARILHGTLDECWDQLEHLNREGAGIFATVNETDFRGREAHNIVAVRAIFGDCDAYTPSTWALDPSFVTISARGPHPYWLLVKSCPLSQFEAAQSQIAAFYGSDAKVKDLPRVMRLPGFIHRKNRLRPVLVRFEGGSLRRYTLSEILSAHLTKAQQVSPGPIAPPLPEQIYEGQGRNNALTSLAGSLRRRALNEDEIRAQIDVVNQSRCRPPLSQREIAQIARSIGRKVPSDPLRSTGSSHSPAVRSAVAEIVRLKDVKREAVQWLWRGRLALGKLAILDGDPGLGKSCALIDIAARITRGRGMPDEFEGTLHEPRNVLLLSAEDGIADTIRARFDEAGGDPERLSVLIAVEREDGTRDILSLTEDMQALEDAVEQVRPVLTIIDPFTAYVGTANTWKDQEIRRVLAALADVAERVGCAFILVRHLNKAKGASALYRGGGSIAIIGAARVGLLAERDPDQNERILFATTKSNLGRQAPTLAYRVEGSRQDPEVAVVVWEEGTDPRSAEQIMAAAGDTNEERSARSEARAFLEEALREGSRPALEVEKEARNRGIAERTLRRAKSDVGVTVKKDSFGGGWVWSLKVASFLGVAILAAFGAFGHLRRWPVSSEEGLYFTKVANLRGSGRLGHLGLAALDTGMREGDR